MNRKSLANQRFFIARGANGCDKTFVIVDRDTNRNVLSFGYWEAEAAAYRNAKLCLRAIVRFHKNGLLNRSAAFKLINAQSDWLI